MTSATLSASFSAPLSARTSRPRPGRRPGPRPGPGYPIAPPAPVGDAPWAALLDGPTAVSGWKWEMSEDGTLLPVPLADDVAGQPKRLTHRLGALLRR